MCGMRTWTGDSGAMAGDSCGNPSASGIFDRSGDSRASSAARDSVRAGAGGWGDEGKMGAAGSRGGRRAEGNGGNEADREGVVWATSCCG